MTARRKKAVKKSAKKPAKKAAKPIELYYWPTPNGWKISIALEEMKLPLRAQAREYRQGRAVRARLSQNLA